MTDPVSQGTNEQDTAPSIPILSKRIGYKLTAEKNLKIVKFHCTKTLRDDDLYKFHFHINISIIYYHGI